MSSLKIHEIKNSVRLAGAKTFLITSVLLGSDCTKENVPSPQTYFSARHDATDFVRTGSSGALRVINGQVLFGFRPNQEPQTIRNILTILKILDKED